MVMVESIVHTDLAMVESHYIEFHECRKESGLACLKLIIQSAINVLFSFFIEASPCWALLLAAACLSVVLECNGRKVRKK